MKKSTLKSKLALFLGAVAVAALSLSFTFSSESKNAPTKVETQQSDNIGGFSQDPK
jgi:hypothetical protein